MVKSEEEDRAREDGGGVTRPTERVKERAMVVEVE